MIIVYLYNILKTWYNMFLW